MRVKEIEYGETKTFGHFENVTVKIRVELDEEDCAEHVHNSIVEVVQKKIAKRIIEPQIERFTDELESLHDRIREREEELHKLNKKLRKVQNLLTEGEE